MFTKISIIYYKPDKVQPYKPVAERLWCEPIESCGTRYLVYAIQVRSFIEEYLCSSQMSLGAVVKG